MHVSGVELPQLPNSDNTATTQQQPANGIFAAFLKSAIGHALSPIRLESGAALGLQITADDTTNTADDYLRTQTNDEHAEIYGPDASDAADGAPVEASNSDGASQESKPAATVTGAALTASDEIDGSQEPAAGAISAPIAAAASAKQNTGGRSQSENAQPAALPANAGIPKSASDQSIVNTATNSLRDENSKGHLRLTAQVSDTPQQIVSRPTNTLAAAAVVVVSQDVV